MTRIQTNVNSLISQRIIRQENRLLQVNLERLSTGLRINRGSDDPSGIIASENLRSEKAAIGAAINNAERAEQVINIAEGGLIEISDYLTQLESLIGSAASPGGLSFAEREAIQLQVDSILATIDRVANQTSFQDLKLLNGNFEYVTSNVVHTHLDEANVNAALIQSKSGSTLPIHVDVVTSANNATLFLSVNDQFGNERFSGQSVTFEVTGANGTQQFTFASGTNATQIRDAINNFSEFTGLSANLEPPSATASSLVVRVSARELGRNFFVSVRHIEGSAYETFIAGENGSNGLGNDRLSAARDIGRDVRAMINGIEADTLGLRARVTTSTFNVEVTLDERFNRDRMRDPNTGNFGATSTSFIIRQGGARFNLSPRAELSGKVSLAVQSVSTGVLGSQENGRLALLKSGATANVIDGNLDRAQRIVRDAVQQLAVNRGRLGAFVANIVRTSINSLGIALENTSAAESQIRDTDFAHETAELTRRQILTQAGTTSLAIANAQPQNVLQLLGG